MKVVMTTLLALSILLLAGAGPGRVLAGGALTPVSAVPSAATYAVLFEAQQLAGEGVTERGGVQQVTQTLSVVLNEVDMFFEKLRSKDYAAMTHAQQQAFQLEGEGLMRKRISLVREVLQRYQLDGAPQEALGMLADHLMMLHYPAKQRTGMLRQLPAMLVELASSGDPVVQSVIKTLAAVCRARSFVDDLTPCLQAVAKVDSRDNDAYFGFYTEVMSVASTLYRPYVRALLAQPLTTSAALTDERG